MVRRILLVAAAVMVPATASAQNFGVAARAGSMGVGGEASLAFGRLIVRGGYGVIPVEFEGTYSDIDYTIEPTSPLMNVGVDYHLSQRMRIGGGLLMVNEPTTLNGEFEGSVTIGNDTYEDEEVGALVGELDHGGAAPYVIIGFGRQNAPGLRFFLDLGAAFMKEATFDLTATGVAASQPQFQADLERERLDAEEAAKDYLRVLPIISLGVRFGFGG